MNITPTQKELYDKLCLKIKEEKFPIFLSGSPGSGKSFILRKLKNEYKGKTITFIDKNTIDDFRKIKHPFNKIKDDNSTDITSKVFIIRWCLILLRSIFTLFIRRTKKSRSLKNDLGDNLYGLLNAIDKFLLISKKRIILLDETNFWDSQSLSVLYYILYSKNTKEVFPNLKKLAFVISFTKEYVLPAELQCIIEKNKCESHSLILNSYTKCDIKSLFGKTDKDLYEKLIVSIDDVNKLSLYSNLAIVFAMAEHLKKSTHNKVSLSEIDEEDINPALYKYINDNINNILKVTSIPTDTQIKEVLLLADKIYNIKELEAKKLLSKISEMKFILPNDIGLFSDNSLNIDFIHREFKTYFQPKRENEKYDFYEKYANVLSVIAPGDYKERAEAYKLGNQIESENLFYSMYIIQLCIRDIYNEDLNHKVGKHLPFVQQMTKAYRSYYNGKSNDAEKDLEQIEKKDLPELLKFEKEYLECRILMWSGDKKAISSIIKIMDKWINKFQTDPFIVEKELYVRIHFLLYVVYLYMGDNLKATASEEQIINMSSQLSKNSGWYDYYYYSLLRRAIVSYSPEIAYKNSMESVAYFSLQDHANSAFLRKERFYSLINFADNCRYVFKYEEALKAISEANNIYEEYKDELPYITLYNSMAIILYENNLHSCQDIITNYLEPIVKNIDIHGNIESTYYIILNNIACLYAENGDIPKAIDTLEKSFTIINNTRDKIENHHYILLINKAVLLYLNGDKTTAKELLTLSKGMYTYGFSEEFHRKRHSILSEIFAKEIPLTTATEFNEFLVSNYDNNNSEIWKHFNKALYLWNMQYWSK